MLTVSPAPTHRANLEVRDGPEVLERVLTTLRRRGCCVIACDYRASDHHRAGWLTVSYIAPPRHEHAVAAWLGNLVDVLSVETAAA